MSTKLPADFPKTAEDWEKVIAAAPGCTGASANEGMHDTVLVRRGGMQAVRNALLRRRGPGKQPAKMQVTLRLPQETLAKWRASGAGWQTRIAEVLTRNAP